MKPAKARAKAAKEKASRPAKAKQSPAKPAKAKPAKAKPAKAKPAPAAKATWTAPSSLSDSEPPNFGGLEGRLSSSAPAPSPAPAALSDAASTPDPRASRPRFADVTIADAVFLRSAPTVQLLPPIEADVPEVAFLGKSNVGKSSLLNALVVRKNLVKTSKTPGQTRLLNQFQVELQMRRSRRRVVFVDLPGYGFAKTSKLEHERLGKMLAGYLGGREGLGLLVHLFDLRHPPTKQDVQMWEDLSPLVGRRLAVGTKSDRVPPAKKQHHAKILAQALGISTSDVLVFSAESREGRLPLWSRILDGLTDDD